MKGSKAQFSRHMCLRQGFLLDAMYVALSSYTVCAARVWLAHIILFLFFFFGLSKAAMHATPCPMSLPTANGVQENCSDCLENLDFDCRLDKVVRMAQSTYTSR